MHIYNPWAGLDCKNTCIGWFSISMQGACRLGRSECNSTSSSRLIIAAVEYMHDCPSYFAVFLVTAVLSQDKIWCRKAEEAANAAAAEEREAAEKAALEHEAAMAAAGASQQPASPPAATPALGPAHDSLDVNLSDSVARELESLADMAKAAEASSLTGADATGPESPAGPPASTQEIEAAIDALDQQVVADGAWLERRSPQPSASPLPNGIPAEAVATDENTVTLGEGPTIKESLVGEGDWDANSTEGLPEPTELPPAAPHPSEAPTPAAVQPRPGAAVAPMPTPAASMPPMPTTSWRRIVSGDTSGPLSPREATQQAAVAALAAHEQRSSAADAQAAAAAAMQGPSSRQGGDRRGSRERLRTSRDGPGGFSVITWPGRCMASCNHLPISSLPGVFKVLLAANAKAEQHTRPGLLEYRPKCPAGCACFAKCMCILGTLPNDIAHQGLL